MKAEEYVDNYNRQARVETAEEGSVEEQLVRHEQWALKQGVKIEAKRRELKSRGNLTEQGIQQEIEKEIGAFEKEAEKRIEKIVKPKLERDRPVFTLPEQPESRTDMLINRYLSLPEQDRRDWFRDARTGKDKELALAFVRAPQRVTGISNDAREAMRSMFMSEKDREKAEHFTDLQGRATAVVDTFEAVRRRLKG